MTEEVASKGVSSTVTITRPNDVLDYAANDVIGAATGSTAIQTFSKVAPNGGGTILIRSTRLLIDANALIASEAGYTLHLYTAAPASAYGDNVAWDLPSGDRALYRGSLALGTPVDVGSSLFIAVDGINKAIHLPGENLYGYLLTAAAYTPTASRVHRVSIVAEWL